MINRAMLLGNLTRDAEAIATNGKAMTRLRVATDSRWTDRDGTERATTEFHAVIAFGRLAEVCAHYGRKGRCVYVEGRLRTRDYTGSDGAQRSRTEIIAETVRFVPPKGGDTAQPAAEPVAATEAQS
jgi:single-strand DNA-binding protein